MPASVFDTLMKELEKRVSEATRAFYENVMPPVDVYEEGAYIVVVADLAGFPKDKVKVRLVGSDELVIEAEREISTPSNASLQQRPRRVRRSVKLPAKVKSEGSTATYENGVLTVKLPIAETVEIKLS
ncbi:MAG: archaeal heat shock protein Hsp14 [Thermoprotei archaeon]